MNSTRLRNGDKMEYTKAVMKMKDLMQMGFPEEFLLSAYRDPRQTFAWKMNPTASNSPILFDTVEFEKYRRAKIELEKKIIKRHEVVC